jgi:hypothetical protein
MLGEQKLTLSGSKLTLVVASDGHVCHKSQLLL